MAYIGQFLATQLYKMMVVRTLVQYFKDFWTFYFAKNNQTPVILEVLS